MRNAATFRSPVEFNLTPLLFFSLPKAQRSVFRKSGDPRKKSGDPRKVSVAMFEAQQLPGPILL